MDKIYYMPIPATGHDFEILMQLVCNKKYGTSFSLYGRNGQKQSGIDLYADNFEICVQCKNYQGHDAHKRLAAEFRKDFYSASRAFGPKMKRYILVTTASRDAKIQELVADFAKSTDVVLECLFWEDIRSFLSVQIIKEYHKATGHDICEQETEDSYELTIAELSGKDKRTLFICNKKMIRRTVAIAISMFVLMVLSVFQLYSYHNDKEIIQSTYESIGNNYLAGNYEVVEQEIYKVYPALERRKKVDLLVSYTDILLEVLYDRWYMNGTPLTESERRMVDSYLSKGKEYSDKKEDMPSYLEFCVHDAKFALSEYEFSLKPQYLDMMYEALVDAAHHFDWSKYATIKVENYEDVRFANEVFNLKNLGVLWLIEKAEECMLKNAVSLDQEYTYYPALDEELMSYAESLLYQSSNLLLFVGIVEDACKENELISSDILHHMRTIAVLSYINCGNLVASFVDQPPVISDSAFLFYDRLDYNNEMSCYEILKTLEHDAIAQQNYYDLGEIYVAAESYFFQRFMLTGDNEVLTHYNEFVERWMKFDPSGINIPPRIIHVGNEGVMSGIMEITETGLSEVLLVENPILYGVMNYKLAYSYLMLADYKMSMNNYNEAMHDYEIAWYYFDSSLLYFSEEQEHMYGSIQHAMRYILDITSEPVG